MSILLSKAYQKNINRMELFDFHSGKSSDVLSLSVGKKFGNLSIGAIFSNYSAIHNQQAYSIKGSNAVTTAKYKSKYFAGFMNYEIFSWKNLSSFFYLSCGKSVNEWYEETRFYSWELKYPNKKTFSKAYSLGFGMKYPYTNKVNIFSMWHRSYLGKIFPNRKLYIETHDYYREDIKHHLKYNNLSIGLEYNF